MDAEDAALAAKEVSNLCPKLGEVRERICCCVFVYANCVFAKVLLYILSELSAAREAVGGLADVQREDADRLEKIFNERLDGELGR